MPINRQFVFSAYQLLLAREPESSLVVKQKIEKYDEPHTLIEAILNSQEYKSQACVQRQSQVTVNQDLIVSAYKLLLCRPPENEEVVNEKMEKHTNIRSLINGIAMSQEYRDIADTSNDKTKRKNNIEFIVNDKEFNQTPKIIYLHIPKTAGSSFHRLASDNLSGRVSLSMPSNIEYDKWVRSKLVGGHYYYSHYNSMTANRLFLSVIRDPVDRALSLFNYYKHANDGMQSLRSKKGFNPTSLKLTIQESENDLKGEFINNCQCLYLSGKRNFNAFHKVSKKDFFIIGTFTEIESWLEYLGKKLKWSRLTLPKVNVSTKSSYMDELKKDKALVQLLHDQNMEDFKLYEYIKSKGVFTNCDDNFDFENLSIINSTKQRTIKPKI